MEPSADDGAALHFFFRSASGDGRADLINLQHISDRDSELELLTRSPLSITERTAGTLRTAGVDLSDLVTWRKRCEHVDDATSGHTNVKGTTLRNDHIDAHSGGKHTRSPLCHGAWRCTSADGAAAGAKVVVAALMLLP